MVLFSVGGTSNAGFSRKEGGMDVPAWQAREMAQKAKIHGLAKEVRDWLKGREGSEDGLPLWDVVLFLLEQLKEHQHAASTDEGGAPPVSMAWVTAHPDLEVFWERSVSPLISGFAAVPEERAHLMSRLLETLLKDCFADAEEPYHRLKIADPARVYGAKSAMAGVSIPDTE